MRRSLFIISAALLALSQHAAGTDLKCEDIKPKLKSIKVMNMEPLRRGKIWLEGKVKNIFYTACDPHGFKTEESEYHQNDLVLKSRFEHKTGSESRLICETVITEKKNADDLSAATGYSLADFCEENRKKTFDAVVIYDVSAEDYTAKPMRQVFRLHNPKGPVSEEYEFDSSENLETRTSYKYDSAGTLVEKTVYDATGSQLRREARAEDKITASRVISFFNENNQLSRKTVAEYRENGTLRREIATTYDAAEQALAKTEAICGANGRRETELVFQGNLEKPIYENRYSYKSDKKGNWIEERKIKLTLYDDKRFEDPKIAPQIVKREITYYLTAPESHMP
jgi:YD repeat-containing protein